MINKSITLEEFLEICKKIAKKNQENPQLSDIVAIARELITSVVYLSEVEEEKSKEEKKEEPSLEETPQENAEERKEEKRKPTYEEWRRFWGKINKLKLSNDDVHRMLGVKSVKDLVGDLTLDEIYQIIEAKLNQKEGGEQDAN